jgi:hypothetical protein
VLALLLLWIWVPGMGWWSLYALGGFLVVLVMMRLISETPIGQG